MSTKKEKKPKEIEYPITPVEPKGICGLINLGNTCYLNSILQCLLHIQELKDYLTSPQLDEDLTINKSKNQPFLQDDKIMQELYYKLLDEFKSLLIQIWSGYAEDSNPKCIINPKNLLEPIEFKNILSKIFKQFEGNLQQDAHEVLISILDTLHLALNRQFNIGGLKITSNSFNTDLILRNTLSCIADASHKAVNDSFIEDTFFGQVSSIFSCYKCHLKIKETYEPFCSLELPIPIEMNINLYILPFNTEIGTNNKEQLKLNMNINDNMSYDDIYEQMSKITGYNFDNYVIFWKNKMKHKGNKKRRNLRNQNNFPIEYNNDDIIINETPFEKCENFMNYKNNELIIMENPKFGDDDKDYEYNIHLHVMCNKNYNQENMDRIFKVDMNEKNEEHLIYNYIYNYLEYFINKKNKNDIIKNNFKINKKNKKKTKPKKITDNNNIEIIELEEDEGETLTCNKYILGILCKNISKDDNNYTNEIDSLICPLCQQKPNKKTFDENYECFCINELLTPELCLKNDSCKELLTKQLINFIKSKSHSIQNILSILIHPYSNFSFHNLNKFSTLITNPTIINKKLNITHKTLLDLVDSFTLDEKIENLSSCNNCGKIKYTYQRKDIHKFPKVLIIHIKRFKNGDEKNSEKIIYPEEIDLSKYNNKGDDGKYVLNSAVFHQGTLNSGHYTSIYKYSPTQQWIYCNDSKLKILNGKTTKIKGFNSINDMVPSSIGDGYILFYRKI